MKAYFIAGIGADYRIFRKIRLPAGYQPEYLHWVEAGRKESLQAYAARFAQKINMHEPFVLIGLSLGGIIASEIARISSPVKTIIISSVPVSGQLPPYFALANKIKLHRLIHPVIGKIATTVKHYLFTEGWENKKIMRQVIWDGDNTFINWGMNAVLNWEEHTIPKNLVHIHGTRDEVFPIRFVRPDHILKGDHMLVFNHADEVNILLEKILPDAQ